MASKNEEKKRVACSFCGKGQEQVRRLIAGNGVFICDECVELCAEELLEELKNAQKELEGPAYKVLNKALSVVTKF